MPSPGQDAILDNWVWHSLIGEQAGVAERRGRAARYRSEVSVFAALDDEAGPNAWADLARMVGPGQGAVLFRGEVDAPDGWTAEWVGAGRQMVLPAPGDLCPPAGLVMPPSGTAPTMSGLPVRLLGPADVPAMVQLTGRTQPGPFLAGTAALGAYLGVHDDGRLVAMAGERSRPPGWTEISAVCTDDAYRGRGLAAGLVTLVARGIFAQGRRAVLHVAADNAGAARVYARLGFTHRRAVDVLRLVAPDP
jgi:ribosomal protein S18 acetylase RimI-like enzyme